MKNVKDTNKSEQKLKKVEFVLDFLFLLPMGYLLDLFENRWSMNKVWMQRIFVAIYAIIWGATRKFF
ncbi:MAG: hypothetical protein LUD18_02170 [Lachnospiraceae bacterium]|nr:hypothetical protein [Lachnospiraceae bacterium]